MGEGSEMAGALVLIQIRLRQSSNSDGWNVSVSWTQSGDTQELIWKRGKDGEVSSDQMKQYTRGRQDSRVRNDVLVLGQ